MVKNKNIHVIFNGEKTSKAINTHDKPVNGINKIRQKWKIEFGVAPDKF
jgi:hypothetical protein